MLEKDLFKPIKYFFETMNYEVKAEVKHMDVVIKKDEQFAAIELKTVLNITVIAQAVKRQSIVDTVYIAIPKPTKQVLSSKTMKDKITLLKRLSVGLLLVDADKNQVDIYLEPLVYPIKRHKKRLVRLKEEFNQRQLSINTGGASRTKIMTVYKEHALIILHALKETPKTAKIIKKEVAFNKVYPILYKNYYGWFQRLGQGLYALTPLGKKALTSYQKEIEILIKYANQ
ncbi:MAG: DUF2161 family putative PD-(D/E)XK-type phosphodiesterase [Acholeplasmataceae bacterium]